MSPECINGGSIAASDSSSGWVTALLLTFCQKGQETSKEQRVWFRKGVVLKEDEN